jgi:hypothetical protein
MEAGTTCLADSIQAAQRGLPMLIRIDSADHVMGGRMNGDQIL